MDSLYYNAPKPFNKYPAGYRPVSGSVHTGSSPLRHFGSMSQLSSQPIDYPPAPLHHNNHNNNFSGSFVSLADVNSNYPSSVSRISQRAGSVGPYEVASFAADSTFSSRAASPMKTFSPVSPPYHHHHQQTTDNQRAILRPDDFLNKLRRQKEEIERTFSRPFYEDERPQSYIPDSRLGEQRPDAMSTWSSAGPAQPLHKTRSDSHIIHDRVYPNGSVPIPVQHYGMARSYIEPRQEDISPSYGNGLLDQAVDRQLPKAGFFRQSLAEPSWMTDPPPPFDIKPRSNGTSSNRSSSFYNDRNSYIQDNEEMGAPRVIPIQLDDDRILKIYTPQPVYNEPEPEVLPNRPLSIHTMSPPYSSRSVPMRATSPIRQNHRPYSPPRSAYQLEQRQQPSYHQSGPPMNVSSVQMNVQPPPPPPPPPMSAPVRIERSQENLDWSRPAVNRERSKTPTGFPEVPPSFREELLSVIPQRSRQTPFKNRHFNPSLTKADDAPFSPVASKVYQGSNRINGFIREPPPAPTAGSFQSDPPPSGAVRSRERSFAVFSRPQTPPVSLEPARQFSPPAQLVRPRQFSPPSSRRDFSPPSRLPSSSSIDNQRTFSPVSPPSSIATSRSQMSPMSAYDNDSETELRGAGPSSHPSSRGGVGVGNGSSQFSHNPSLSSYSQQHQHQPPQGILVKKHDTPRPSKKVVFQCDADVMQRIRHNQAAPPHVLAYDEAMEEVLDRFKGLMDKIGGDVATVKPKLVSIFEQLRSFLWTAAGRAKPSQDEMMKMLAPISNLMGDVANFTNSKRNTPLFNHLSALSEGVQAVAWVTVEKIPAPHVAATVESVMFYVNRILKEFKEGDQTHVEFAKTWKEVLETMQKFVRQTHTTGLVWNSAPGSAPSGSSRPSGPPPPPAGGPPPPPPPPPCDLMAGLNVQSSGASDADKAGRDALFAQLNKGEGVTAGLKKVTSDMQTHKNPSLRTQSTVPGSTAKGGSAGSAPAPAASVQRPPKTELHDGKQWNVEYHKNNNNIIITADLKQTVYVYKCENCVIQVKGKLNSITLDGCKKTSVVFDALLAQCETINCQSVKIQTLGMMPTLSIQKTDGCQVFLSEEAKNTEIVTSKSSEMNICVPQGPDGEFAEFAVPEQFKTVWNSGKLVTTVSDII